MDLDAVSESLANLSSSGNVQALTQQAVAAGSVMNAPSAGNQTTADATNQAIKV